MRVVAGVFCSVVYLNVSEGLSWKLGIAPIDVVITETTKIIHLVKYYKQSIIVIQLY